MQYIVMIFVRTPLVRLIGRQSAPHETQVVGEETTIGAVHIT